MHKINLFARIKKPIIWINFWFLCKTASYQTGHATKTPGQFALDCRLTCLGHASDLVSTLLRSKNRLRRCNAPILLSSFCWTVLRTSFCCYRTHISRCRASTLRSSLVLSNPNSLWIQELIFEHLQFTHKHMFVEMEGFLSTFVSICSPYFMGSS